MIECNFIDLVLHIETNNRAHLAVSLPLWGALYSELCRSASCPFPGRLCRSCSRSADCDWFRIFGQELSVDPEALRRHQKPPLPFVFSFPMLDDVPASPGIVACGLTIIGCAVFSMNMLLDGFEQLLSDSACQEQAKVVQLFSRDYQGVLVPFVRRGRIAPAKNLVVLSMGGILDSRVWCSQEVEIVLHSPLKLRADGHEIKKFEFGRFCRSLLRRISSLNYYYEKYESGFDFKYLSQRAEAISCSENTFSYDPAPSGIKKLSGIIGQGRFRGDFNELMPFLVAGSYFNVGKSSAFGMGCFTLSTVPG
jgi:hypothetical protein